MITIAGVMFASLLASAGCNGASTSGASFAALRGKLSKEAQTIQVVRGAVPGNVVVDGVNSVPLAYGKVGRANATVAAAGVFGKGRAVAVTHGGFFDKNTAGFSGNIAFMRECMTWLAGGAKPSEVYVDVNQGGIRAFIELAGFKTKSFSSYDSLSALPCDAVVVTSPDSRSLADAEKLKRFFQRGGRLFASVVGWGWNQLNPGKRLAADSAFNAVLGSAGIYASGSLVGASQGSGYQVCAAEMLPGTTVSDAFDLIEGKAGLSRDAAANSLFTIESMIGSLPAEEKKWRTRLEKYKSKAMKAIPSPSKPFDLSMSRERLAYVLMQNEWLSDPVREWPAHPAAVTYPGVPSPESKRITREIPVNLAVPRWHSTGLFAAAGEPLEIVLAEGSEKLGLRVRVGSTTCRNTSHDVWRRAPVVDVEIPLKRRVTRFSSPFGGLIYIVVPRKTGGVVNVKVGPACPAPHFVEGRDTPETWKAQLKESSAPFAEIESERIVLTVPRSAADRLDDPGAALQVWREIMDNSAELVSVPAERESPERICIDVQLCCGYMHAGYPIMVPDGCSYDLVDHKCIREGKKDEVWGFFHEMGHNHQSGDWTFNGSVEVTVNFFSLYNRLKICGRSIRDNGKIGSAHLAQRVEKWKAEGRPMEKWRTDPFLALDFFARLIEKYGWDSFKKLFAEYRALPDSERPKSDIEKRRQWCQRLSRIVGEDLTSEFEFMLKD